MNETAPAEDLPPDSPEGDAVAPAPVEGRRARRRRSRGGGWLDYVVTMVVALVIAVLVKTFLIQPFFIPSESMVPTLEIDDKILVSKLTPGVFDLHRGDVIVFEDPDNWVDAGDTRQGARYQVLKVLSYVGLAPDPAQDHLVKRLIGMPGDHVVCAQQGGDLQVNGVTIDEPYINQGATPCQAAFDITVPAGNVWVMGDNREASADSANHYTVKDHSPYVPESKITGKAEVIMWPASRWTVLDDGEKAFADVPDPS
ncbi:signal peptidase I [Brachybacterium sp. AOP25-B2-12]|uniref:signal peptidase I n=1 Tax=Brachybacterium sp. AOP25-B2-12 TaxID=3457710 RepID=UPI00403316D9